MATKDGVETALENLNLQDTEKEQKESKDTNLPQLPDNDWSSEGENDEEEKVEEDREEQLSLADAIDCMNSILQELKDPTITQRINDTKEKAQGDMSIIMSEIVPLFYEVQGHVMEPYGFEPDDDGFADFSEALQSHETDENFKALSDEFKAIIKDSTTWIAPEEESHITA